MKPKGKRIAIAAGALALAVLGVAGWLSWPHMRFWWLFEPLGPNAQGYPEYRHRKTGIVFVGLPGGKFWMGAQKDDPKGRNYCAEAANHEGPVHEVILSPFLVGKHEVTEGEWFRVMGDSREEVRRNGSDSQPVVVSWIDCLFFSEITGLSLPSEAQWEYTCRGGAEELPDGAAAIRGEGRQGDALNGIPDPPNVPPSSELGLYHLQGNVREWCSDTFSLDYYGRCPREDPENLEDISGMVTRGGPDSSEACACTRRDQQLGHYHIPGLGFRVVASPPP